MIVPRHTSNRPRTGRVVAATGVGLTLVLGAVAPAAAVGTGGEAPSVSIVADDTVVSSPDTTTPGTATTAPGAAPDDLAPVPGPTADETVPPDPAVPDAASDPVGTAPPAVVPDETEAPASPATTSEEVGPTAVAAAVAPTPFTVALNDSRRALTQAEVYLTNHQYDWAGQSLSSLRASLNRAHALGMAHIGPVKVAEIFRFEHRIVMRLLPFYDGLTDATTLAALQSTLMTTFADRVAMMDKVAAADPEGPFDYTDGLADTVPLYNTAAKAYRAAVAEFQLTPEARTALIACRARVLAFQARFTAKFGGGE